MRNAVMHVKSIFRSIDRLDAFSSSIILFNHLDADDVYLLNRCCFY